MKPFILLTVGFFAFFFKNSEANVNSISSSLREDVKFCLEEANLTLSDLEISSIEELQSYDLVHIHNLPENKRNCYMACWFKRNKIINENGTINTENLPEPLPGKEFPISFEDSINKCRALNNYCEVGGCLYAVYYL